MSVNTAWQPLFHSVSIGGDRRYRYVPFYQLFPEDQRRARAAYVYKSVGAMYDFVDEHYLYPVDKRGHMARGRVRRELAIPYALINDDDYMASIGYQKNPGW